MTYMLREHLLLEKRKTKEFVTFIKDQMVWQKYQIIWQNMNACGRECGNLVQSCHPTQAPASPAAAGCVHIVIWHNSRTLSYLTTSHSGTLFYIGRHSWTVYKVLLILGLLHSKSKTSWSRSWSVDPSKLQNTGIHKTFRHCRMASHPTVWFGLEWLGVACFGILCKILAGQYHKVR